MTLECLRELYNFHYESVSTEENSIAVGESCFFDLPPHFKLTHTIHLTTVEYGENSYLGSDLDIFFEKFSPQQVGRRPELVSIAGGKLWPLLCQVTAAEWNDAMAGYLNYSTNNVKNNGEADMDFDLVMGLLPEQNVYLYQIGKSSQDPYNGE